MKQAEGASFQLLQWIHYVSLEDMTSFGRYKWEDENTLTTTKQSEEKKINNNNNSNNDAADDDYDNDDDNDRWEYVPLLRGENVGRTPLFWCDFLLLDSKFVNYWLIPRYVYRETYTSTYSHKRAKQFQYIYIY